MESRKNSHEENVIIVSGDSVFARMLELELKKEHIPSKTVSDVTGAPALIYLTSAYPLSIFDADLIFDEDPNDSPILKESSSEFIVFSQKKYDSLPKSVTAFFTRPFDIKTFIITVKKRLAAREFESEEINTKKPTTLKINGKTKSVTFGINTVRLSNREFELFALLYSKKGNTVTKDDIKNAIWNDKEVDRSNIDNVYIRYLREKLDDRFGIKLIYTVRNKGYMLKIPE